MEYRLVFDIAQSGFKNWFFVAPGVGFTILGLLQLRFYRYLPTWPFKFSDRFKRGYAIFFVGFAAVWTVSVFLGTYGDYLRLMQARRTGNYQIVEGRVTDFIPMPYEGHQDESFRVEGIHFSYSDYQVSAGFNQTASHGGPIRSGLPVRIGYVGNTIITLEVKKQTL